ncbi:MAG: anthranilate phosphoribosyltransferase [Candidatus Omnitrophica bacterium]|nr:anthranilate phosphoribosyltransferase [Candidatus Omnitrophota bacterium]
MIQEVIEILSRHNDLTGKEMELSMEEIMTGKIDTPLIVSFLTALNEKGETLEELTAAVSVMRRHATRIKTKHKLVLDTCGTGGDNKGTFNISTAVAFVVSGSGVAVAKHGNRSVSSRSGSADILEALGININMEKDRIEKCLDEIGIAFLFAPNLHPAMKYAMPARREIGKRTMFNILGPLTNPAQATHQLVGVYDRQLVEILAGVLGNLGSSHALVVHGQDGLDEISTTSKTFISEEYKGKIKNYEVAPEDFGFKRVKLEDLSGGTASDNANILLDILNGKPGPGSDIVLLNAAFAIYAADKVKSVKKGIELARQSINSKKAKEKIDLLKEYSLEN